MAAETGVPAIKRLLISLLVISAVACGLIYVIVSPPEPVSKPVVSETPSRTLAYQQRIERGEPAQTTSDTQQQALAPADAAPASAPSQSAPPPQTQAAVPPQPAPQQDAPPEMAGVPPDDEPYDDPDALPWQQRVQPNHPGAQYPGAPAEAYGPPGGAWPGEDGYQQDAEAWPGEDADPNAWPAGPGAEPQEFVQVLVSGAAMHGMASDDAPMLFAFPYGRTLRVISRYGNWVEVTDPQSATTGWMKAQYLAPAVAPGSRQQVEAWYEDEPPRRRRGWFRRNGGEGIGDMIGRALGGAF